MDHFEGVDDVNAGVASEVGADRSVTVFQRTGETVLGAIAGREHRFSQKTRGRVGAAVLTTAAIVANQAVEHFTGINPFLELCINAPQ